MADILEIKRKTSCIEYAQRVLGLPIKVAGDRCKSLAPGSKNPTALVIYNDWWYDHKLGVGGDVIDLCAIARHEGDKGEAIRELGGTSTRWREYTENLNNGVAYWHTKLRESDLQYLRDRRIYQATIDRLLIGFDPKIGRLVIPYWKNGYICYYITRDREEGKEEDADYKKYSKAKLDVYNENIPWGLHTLGLAHDFVVITEGAFDALSFEQEGYIVLSTMGGYFGKKAQKQVIEICKTKDRVILCFDNDDSGDTFQVKMAQELFKNKVQFFCATLPSGKKDVSEYYAGNGNLQKLIDKARPGLNVLCERITDRRVLKSFVFQAARCVGKPEMAELFELINKQQDRFGKAWLQMLEKQALAPPQEDMVANEIIANYRLKYFDALGFYEFALGAWRRLGESEIKRYIDDALGSYSTGARLGAIYNILKSRCVSTEVFDRQAVFNFLNGTLDLEEGVLREHNEGFLCSMQVDYNYDENAWSARWEQFIEEICEGDERKMCLLQEIAGYVLFNDNRLQKCFFLVGEGANGKSVFLDILSAVFGSAQVSNVEISGLIEPFQRIRLLNSILNMSSETQSNVKGAESIFKQLVVGDTVSGCFKNRDFIEFRTRAKFIAACNEYVKSRDSSTGFFRRICLVAFNARFVDDPEEGEMKADRELTQKLKEELPGIFNWCYQGYRILREQGQFTETYEQQEMAEDFMQLTNPVAAFLKEEELIPGRWTRDVLYDRYKAWCKSAGHEPLSRTAFIRRFKSTIKQLKRKDIKEYRSVAERGFEVGA